jgi:ABC-2 type transport system ATP-binding protein
VLAIRTEHLTKDFAIGFWRPRPDRALDDLNLEVKTGEVFGFLGPNGAGKTTTLKLLMQLIFPTSGRAEILGRPVGDVAMKRRIGYLPESPYFYDHLTAEELLEYFAGLFGFRGSERTARVTRLLNEVGIGKERRMPLRRFSKGMLQRVGIAQALINDPEVVFLDEPMSGLDPLGRRDVRNLILRLRDQGTTLFFSSHVLSDAEALCSRVAILTGGRLAASGTMADIHALEVRGWELVVSRVSPTLLQSLSGRVTRITPISDGRFALEVSLETPPERLLDELIRQGATLVSLNPMRYTLEDYFVDRVTHQAHTRPVDA